MKKLFLAIAILTAMPTVTVATHCESCETCRDCDDCNDCNSCGCWTPIWNLVTWPFRALANCGCRCPEDSLCGNCNTCSNC